MDGRAGRPRPHLGVPLRVYSGQELRARLGAAGFATATLYGGLDGRPYDVEAERPVVVARR